MNVMRKLMGPMHWFVASTFLCGRSHSIFVTVSTWSFFLSILLFDNLALSLFPSLCRYCAVLIIFCLFFLFFFHCWLSVVSQDSLNAYSFKVNQHSFYFVWNQKCLHYLQQRIQTYATLVRQCTMPLFLLSFLSLFFVCVVEETTTISYFGTTGTKKKWSNNERKTWRKHHHFCRASQKSFREYMKLQSL